MTYLEADARGPPEDVFADANEIVEKANAQKVVVEDAVDKHWFIRVEGPTDDGSEYALSEEQFEDMTRTIESLLGGTHAEFRPLYEAKDGQYLIRIEY